MRKSFGILLFLIVLNVACGLFLWWAFNQHEYAASGMLWMALLIPLLSVWYILRQNSFFGKVKLSSARHLLKIPESLFFYYRHLFFALRMAGILLIIIAIARPQSSKNWQDVSSEGIDIIIALDVSASMLSKDFNPNRLEGSKRVAIDFIHDRPSDRIGLVVYEGEAFSQVPLTTDHRVLTDIFHKVNTGLLEGGTAVGMGLATAVNRLQKSDAKSKVIILLTDGVNNAGSIAPQTAAEIAREYDIRVYTIGVGTTGMALSPVAKYPNGTYDFKNVPVEIDEETLKEIAAMTGGQYFRADNNKKLEEIYSEIDKLEKSLIHVTEHSSKKEEYLPYALVGFLLIISEIVMRYTLFRSAP